MSNHQADKAVYIPKDKVLYYGIGQGCQTHRKDGCQEGTAQASQV